MSMGLDPLGLDLDVDPIIDSVPDDIESVQDVLDQRYNVDNYRDAFGSIRVRKIRDDYDLDYNDDADMNLIGDICKAWVQDDEYIVLEREERKIHQESSRHLPLPEKKYVAVKASKRGNDVHNARNKRRFERIVEGLENLPFSDDLRTRMLYVTLTYDTGKCDRETAWRSIGGEYNSWITAMRKRYGKIDVMRCWESFANGYPHIHALLYFREKKWSWKRREENDYRMRIYKEKQEIDELWHSHVDVQAVVSNNLTNCADDVVWYILKFADEKKDPDNWSYKEKLTLGATWYFGLRAFAISQGKGSIFTDLSRTDVHNSNGEDVQVDLEGNVTVEITWSFVGMIGGKVLRSYGCDTSEREIVEDGIPDWLHRVWMPSSILRSHAVGSLGEAFK